MRPNTQFPADLVTFTDEIFNGKLHFLCSVKSLGSSGKKWSHKTSYINKFKSIEISGLKLKNFDIPA